MAKHIRTKVTPNKGRNKKRSASKRKTKVKKKK